MLLLSIDYTYILVFFKIMFLQDIGDHYFCSFFYLGIAFHSQESQQSSLYCFLQGLEFSIILLVWVIPNARNPNILCYLTYIWFISFTHSIKQKERGYFKHIDADIFDEYKPEEMPKCFIQLAWSNHIRDSVTKRWISFKTYLS